METKLKFKVGDRVRVKSLEWYFKQEKNEIGTILKGCGFTEVMSKFCSKELTIKSCDSCYKVLESEHKWEDWMFEDYPVTDVKQEDKLLNQSDMETKEMTREEIFAYLNETKILCTSTKETTNVQEKLFELDIEWVILGRRVDSRKYLLFIRGNKLEYTPDIDFWVRSEKKRIEPDEILAIQIKEEKPKFNQQTLQPYDKVLVRDNVKGNWRCNLFSHLKDTEEFNYQCVSNCWNFCVPYNEETKHLVGTAQDAPEYYNIWE
jgi:hypothetical protein